MAPRGRKRKAGLMRADAARDAMRAYGFQDRVINACIKDLLKVYGEEHWVLIEESGYLVLLNSCLEYDHGKTLAEDKKEELAEERNEEIAEEEQQQTAQEEEEKHALSSVLQDQEHQIEDGRDHVGSNSTSLVGCDAGTGTQTCQTDALSITSETDIRDSSPSPFPLGEASVVDYASPVALQSADASGDYAHHSVRGAKTSGCGWLSEEEETDPDEDSVGDDDEMIQLTPEPLCEELEELLREIRGEKKRKKPTRWDN